MKNPCLFFGAVLAVTSLGAAELPELTCDVAVVGGGSAGICAAVQSGRAGAQTVLIEAASQIGGATTSGGVNFPGLFHAWGRQVISGIGWELVTNTVALAGETLPDFTQPTGRQHWRQQVTVNIPLYVALAEEMLKKAGVRICYQAAPMRIEAVADGWRVTTVAVGDTRTVVCKQLVDCTGNGAVAGLLGLERLREDERQPGSFAYTLRVGADLSQLDGKALQARFEQAVKDGAVTADDCRWGVMGFLKAGGNVGNYVAGADSSDADSKTDANLRGRASMLRMVRWLKTIPELGEIRLESMAPEVGVRETYRVAGEYLITGDDYVTGKRWPDSVCYAFYPVDMHSLAGGVKPAHLKEGIVPTVPLRALIPKGSRNLLVAGRCLSSDRLANSGLRVQATCMATGQAAGAAAALAAQRGVTPAEVPFGALRTLLTAQGAIVPDAE